MPKISVTDERRGYYPPDTFTEGARCKPFLDLMQVIILNQIMHWKWPTVGVVLTKEDKSLGNPTASATAT